MSEGAKQLKKIRIDQLIFKRGLEQSREKAKALIMSGMVLVDGERVDKAGEMVLENCEIKIKGSLKYVSRGGLKLEKAILSLKLDLSGLVCLDVGASTGGFTDCMLQNGARKVYAVDVGYGQLAWKLRVDQRVRSLERVNARYLTKAHVPEDVDFASVDVSFISLTLVLPVLYGFLKENAVAVVLIKPQFEAGRDQVGKKGVVRDFKVHEAVLKKIYSFCVKIGFSVIYMDYSPIQGPEGNIEYLFALKKGDFGSVDEDLIVDLVRNSHDNFNKNHKQ